LHSRSPDGNSRFSGLAVPNPFCRKINAHDIRIFSQQTADQKGVSVKNYTSLDTHPELVLYEGYYNKQSREVHIESSMKKAV
jgi:hypothetical protein